MKAVERLHVATRTPIDHPGGLNTAALQLATAQARSGQSVALMHSVLGHGGTLWTPGRPASASLQDVAAIEADVIEFHFAQTAAPLLRRLRADQAKVFHFHGPWFHEARVQGQSLAHQFGKWLTEMKTYHRFTVLTAHSQDFAGRLARSFGIRQDRIEVVPLGVDTDRFIPGDQQEARRRLGIPQSRGFTIGALRRLEPRMGLSSLIEAVSRIPEAELLIGGQGSLAPALKRQIADLGMSDRAHLLGRVPDADLPSFYQALDVAVVPTLALEGFGLVVLEAMACGTPCIATTVGGLPEAMGPYEQAWTYRPGNVAELEALLRVSADDRPSQAELVAYANENSWTSVATRIEDIISRRCA